ncbi:hypothetical protein BV375_16860 [Nostoc sp. 106C]|nr:hypothetical protein BV375_16860 [Nostoc sp. 106C]
MEHYYSVGDQVCICNSRWGTVVELLPYQNIPKYKVAVLAQIQSNIKLKINCTVLETQITSSLVSSILNK